MKKQIFPKEIIENTLEVHQFKHTNKSKIIYSIILKKKASLQGFCRERSYVRSMKTILDAYNSVLIWITFNCHSCEIRNLTNKT